MMAWYPGAIRMELQPESDEQPAIRPTQFIVHSIIAPWTAQRTYEYWRDSTNLESHFGVDYEGVVGQYIGTHTRADANAGANRRPDGTGAVSAETASNLEGSDPWNAKQVEDLIAIGAWLHHEEGLPLRICRTHDDPGYGYHSMFPQWSTSGTACPGAARIKQFREVVFPGIVARATGQTTPPQEDEDPMTLTDAELDKIARLVWAFPGDDPLQSGDAKVSKERLLWGIALRLYRVEKAVDGLDVVGLTDAQVQALAVGVAEAPGLADAIAAKVADLLAARLAE